MNRSVAVVAALVMGAIAAGAAQASDPVARAGAFNPNEGVVRLTYADYHTGKNRQGCGRIGGKWVPGQATAQGPSGVRFVSYTVFASNYRRVLAKPNLSDGKRKTYSAKLAQYEKLAATRGTRCVFVAMRFNFKGAVGVAQKQKASGRSDRANTRQTGGGTLQSVLADGSLRDAVVNGSAKVQSIVVAPDGKAVYLVFQQRVNLVSVADPGDCVIAKVEIANGAATCVDTTLQNVNAGTYYSSYGDQKPLQFDDLGGVYYAGYGTCNGSCKYVLRRWRGGEITDLIADESQVQSFTVTGNGTVFMTGTSPGTGQQFARRLSPAGSLKNIVFGAFGGGFRLFPDGNIYGSYSSQGQCNPSTQECQGLARYDVAADRQDEHLWIGNALSRFDWGAITGSNSCCSSTFGNWDNRVATTSAGEVVYFRQGNADLAYPTPAHFVTQVYNVGIARAVGSDVIVAGTKANGANIVTRFNGATHTETVIAADGVGPGEIEMQHINYSLRTGQILFDGLRFADNTYVIGTIDAATNAVSILSANSGKLTDFQTF